MVDLVKHLATLSLGAIALIAAFLQSLVELGDNKLILKFVVICFLTCIIIAVNTSV